MNDLPPNGLSATQARDKIRDGWLTSVELVTACLDRIEETDGQVKAWTWIDREHALQQARDLDAIRMNGKPMGALHGVPVGLKDIIDTADMPTRRGSSIFEDRQPVEDATIVSRLREAGAVILGKTATTELAFVHPCDTCNPHNPEHTPGGSSSGSAAAVAAYHTPLAIGSQTNGSVIRPASFCGTFGYKPTAGIIPRTGLLQTSRTLDQVGVFARTLEDAALLSDTIAIHDPADPDSYPRPRPKTVSGWQEDVPVEPDFAWIELPFSDRLSGDSIEAMAEIRDALDGRVEVVAAPDGFADLLETQRLIHEREFCEHLGDTLDANWEAVSPTLKPVVERGRQITAEQYAEALAQRAALQSFFDEFFKDYDAILTPSSTGEAPRIDSGHTGDPAFCTIWTLAGLPCINLPLLAGSAGLPIGVQLVGGKEEDARLVRTGRWMLEKLQA